MLVHLIYIGKEDNYNYISNRPLTHQLAIAESVLISRGWKEQRNNKNLNHIDLYS